MWDAMKDMFEFLSTKARGLAISLAGTGIGSLPEVVGDVKNNTPTLEALQMWAFTASIAVAVLTIISYIYKFVCFLKKTFKRR